MQPSTLVLVLCAMAAVAYWLGRRRSLELAGAGMAERAHSLPKYYGYYAAMWCLLPALLVALVWLMLEPVVIGGLIAAVLQDAAGPMTPGELDLLLNNVRNLAAAGTPPAPENPWSHAAASYSGYVDASRSWLTVVCTGTAAAAGLVAWRRVSLRLRARNKVESAMTGLLLAASSIAVLTTVGIVFSMLFEALRFFREVPLTEFLFGLDWSPQTAIREDQVGASGSFGAVPLFTGTLLVTGIAMVVAVPVGLATATFLAEYAARRTRAVVKPVLEILAGIPTVVYGFFAALMMAPAIRRAGDAMGLSVASESALAAGLVMGIMIIPLVSSLADDAINAVPRSLRDGALALGATRSEAMIGVVFPAALPGIAGGVLLAVSRAIGETMIVVMAAGLAANLTANPLEAVTTVTVQIVTLLVGDQEFDSPKTLAAFALGLVLFVATLALNVLGLKVVRKYREQYE